MSEEDRITAMLKEEVRPTSIRKPPANCAICGEPRGGEPETFHVQTGEITHDRCEGVDFSWLDEEE